MWGILVSKIIKIGLLFLNLQPIIWVDVFFETRCIIKLSVAQGRSTHEAESICLTEVQMRRRKSPKLPVRNWVNLVGMVNARIDWKLVTLQLYLWPWELFLCYFVELLIAKTQRNLLFGMEVHDLTMVVMSEVQGHGVKVKVTPAGLCSPRTQFNYCY